MQIRIVGDGTVGNTEVVVVGTNERIEGITAIDIHLDGSKDLAEATLTFHHVRVDMTAELKQSFARFPSRAWFIFVGRLLFRKREDHANTTEVPD